MLKTFNSPPKKKTNQKLKHKELLRLEPGSLNLQPNTLPLNHSDLLPNSV